jgi:RND family efflux transporter MFP subunit
MNKILKISIILLIIIGTGFAAIKFNLLPFGNQNITQKAKQEIWLCPMHPTYTSDRQGDCPICGMRLVKKEIKEKDENKKIVERKIDHSMMKMEEDSEESQGTKELKLEIDPVKEQYLGIKTTKAKLKDVQKEIKALGTVTPDETRLAHIHTKFSGYIQKVFADYEGKLVEKGQPLFTVYSPELVSTQEELLLALEAEEKLKGNEFPEIARSQAALLSGTKRRLELWDISDEQIDKLRETKHVTKELTIYSPVNGFITKREAFEGTQIAPENTLYDIVDLSRVWVIVEVYENDLPFVMIGQTATINFPYENIKPFIGKVTYIYPEIEPTTRTLKIRVEVNNPGFKLKPDMYVNAILATNIGKHVVVPTRAAIDSGQRQIVFVKEKEGKFIPKEVKLGPEVNNERVVYFGINDGDEVVTDGNFLLDSESNLETSLEQMKGHSGH